MKLNEVYFSSRTVITHFLDKPYQEISFKSHLNRVLPCKQGKILSDLHMFRVILFHFTWIYSLLQWDWKVPIIKNIKMSSIICLFDFILIPLFAFTLVIKLRNFYFESHWNILTYFDKEIYGVIFEYVPWKNVWFCFISIVWFHLSYKTEKFSF